MKLVSEVLENDTLLFIFTVPVELIVRMQMMLQKPHTSKCVYALVLAKDVNWLRVWDAARDKGQLLTGIAQVIYKLLTTPVLDTGTAICVAPSFHLVSALLSISPIVILLALLASILMTDLTSESELSTNFFTV